MSSAADPSGLVIDGGIVATMDEQRTRFSPGFVWIRDGAIEAVGSAEEAVAGGRAEAERIDARGCVVVPGLINTHQHHWYNLFKGLGGGMLLEQWIQNLLAPTAAAITPADLEAAARLACLEMIGTGTTTCLNHSVTATGPDEVQATLEPVVESGMRQLFAKEVRPAGLDEQLALATEVHERWHGAGDGRVAIGLVLESTAHWIAMGTSSEQLIERGNELAAGLGVPISDHVASGTMSREHGYLRSVLEMGRTDIEFLRQLGVLDSKWVLAHAINARDRDIELIAECGASISHTPTSESARAGGFAPVKRFRDAGIPVHLGSDGPMVDTSVDMVEQMKVAILIQNQLHGDPLALTPEDALAMATTDGARALGLSERIGSLEPGKRGDVAIFDLEAPAGGVWHDPIAAFVHGARTGGVRDVIVDGVALVRDGQLTRADRAVVREVVDEARTRAGEVLDRADVPAHRLHAAERSDLEAIV